MENMWSFSVLCSGQLYVVSKKMHAEPNTASQMEAFWGLQSKQSLFIANKFLYSYLLDFAA